jgi:CubicO group peptidase (beta-lactamase class C family)
MLSRHKEEKMKTQFICFAIVTVLLCPSLSGQQNANNVKSDLNNEKVAQSFHHVNRKYEQSHPMSLSKVATGDLDVIMTAFMQTNNVPGLAACIVKRDRIAWEGYYGLANIALKDSVKPSTVFLLASVSKTVTAAALMQLYERGRFKLDDSINAYLTFPVRNPYFPSSVITFRQLLCHVSSIRDTWSAYPSYSGDPPIALGTYLREYLTPGGSFYYPSNYSSAYPPGTAASYCNVAVSLCGYLVELISGKPFDQYCRDSIFVPLGMTNTAWFLRDLDISLIAARPYTGTYDNGLYGEASYPDGMLRTTVRSLAKFLGANIGYGKIDSVRILDSTTIRLMRTIHYPSLDPGQGMIWWTYLLGQRWIWGKEGADRGASTIMALDEMKNSGVIILTNCGSITDAAWLSILDAVFAAADTLTVSGIPEIAGTDLPTSFILSQNYPNPFNPSTTIRYGLPHKSQVSLMVYNTLGQQIAVLVHGEQEAGYHEVRFDASGLSSGVYFYRLQAGDFVQTRKLLLLR